MKVVSWKSFYTGWILAHESAPYYKTAHWKQKQDVNLYDQASVVPWLEAHVPSCPSSCQNWLGGEWTYWKRGICNTMQDWTGRCEFMEMELGHEALQKWGSSCSLWLSSWQHYYSVWLGIAYCFDIFQLIYWI